MQLDSQILNGRIMDAQTLEPLSYVNVGVVNRGIGTVSDEKASFQLDLSGAGEKDLIRISYVGYGEFEIEKGKLDFTRDFHEFYLNKTSYDLSTVVVKPRKLRQKVLGNTTKSKALHLGFSDNLLGCEMGVIMKANGRPTWLDSIKINISHCGYDSIFFRVNVYEFNDKLPDRNILKDPIYLSLSKEDVGGTISIDMRDFEIYTEKDFLVSLELVKDLGPGNLYFSTGFFLSPIYYRSTSQDTWKKFSFGAGIAAYVTQEK